MQDAYNELLAGSDLLNSDSYGRDGGDMYVDPEAFYERLEQLPPEVQRQELQVGRCIGAAWCEACGFACTRPPCEVVKALQSALHAPCSPAVQPCDGTASVRLFSCPLLCYAAVAGPGGAGGVGDRAGPEQGHGAAPQPDGEGFQPVSTSGFQMPCCFPGHLHTGHKAQHDVRKGSHCV